MASALKSQLLADFGDGVLADDSLGTVVRFVCHAATSPLPAAATQFVSPGAIDEE